MPGTPVRYRVQPMNLLPLEVLPGWPQPEPVSDTFLMLLMVIGPLAFGVIVALLYFGPKLARERRELLERRTRVLACRLDRELGRRPLPPTASRTAGLPHRRPTVLVRNFASSP